MTTGMLIALGVSLVAYGGVKALTEVTHGVKAIVHRVAHPHAKKKVPPPQK